MPGGQGKQYQLKNNGGGGNRRNRTRKYYLTRDEIERNLNYARENNAIKYWSDHETGHSSRRGGSYGGKLSQMRFAETESVTSSTSFITSGSSQVSPTVQLEPQEERRAENGFDSEQVKMMMMGQDKVDDGMAIVESSQNVTRVEQGSNNDIIIGPSIPPPLLPIANLNDGLVDHGQNMRRYEVNDQSAKNARETPTDDDNESLGYVPHTPDATPPPTPPLTPPEAMVSVQKTWVPDLALPMEPGLPSSSLHSIKIKSILHPPPQLCLKQENVTPPPLPNSDIFMNFNNFLADPSNNPSGPRESKPWLKAPTIPELIDKLLNSGVTQEAARSFERMTGNKHPEVPQSPYFSFFPGPSMYPTPVNMYISHSFLIKCILAGFSFISNPPEANKDASNTSVPSATAGGFARNGGLPDLHTFSNVASKRAPSATATATVTSEATRHEYMTLNYTLTDEGPNQDINLRNLRKPLSSGGESAFRSSMYTAINGDVRGRNLINTRNYGFLAPTAPPPPPLSPIHDGPRDYVNNRGTGRNETMGLLQLGPGISGRDADTSFEAIGETISPRFAAHREVSSSDGLKYVGKGNPDSRPGQAAAVGSKDSLGQASRKRKRVHTSMNSGEMGQYQQPVMGNNDDWMRDAYARNYQYIHYDNRQGGLEPVPESRDSFSRWQLKDENIQKPSSSSGKRK